jgi:hypothetical protein
VFFIDSSGRSAAAWCGLQTGAASFLPLETSARFSEAIVWRWGREGYQAKPCPEVNQAIAISPVEKGEIAPVAWTAFGFITT